MTANNANSKISMENCQRFMKRQVVQNKNYSSLGLLSIGNNCGRRSRLEGEPERQSSGQTLELSPYAAALRVEQAFRQDKPAILL
jgi:hypothetical protein